MELIGMRASRGPLNNTTLELRPGLTALYGLNGAGKSNILKALTWALTGVAEQGQGPGSVMLFFRLGDDDDQIDGWDPDVVTPAELVLAKAVLRSGCLPGHQGEIGRRHTVEGDLERPYVLSIIERDLDAWEYPEGLPEELLDSHVIGLRPVGFREPRWEVWLCGEPSAKETVLAEHIRCFRGRLDGDIQDPQSGEATDKDSRRDYRARVSEREILLRLQYPNAGLSQSMADHEILFEAGRESMELRELPLDDGMPLPLARLGVVDSIEPLGIVTEPDLASAEARTASAATVELSQTRRRGGRADESVASEDLKALRVWASEISSRATATFRSVLLDAPELALSLRPPQHWLTTRGTQWVVEDGIPLHALSHAQRRWAAFAIYRHTRSQPTPVRAIDEPEAALHRSAEEHMARGLAELAAHDGGAWVVATHSPALLDDPRSHVMHVKRVDGRTRVSPLMPEDLDDLGLMGLTPSDLLRRWRVFLLVEGRHEELILNTIFRQQLHAARVLVLPLHGGRKLPTAVDSRLLWDFTDAHVVAVLDNMDAEAVELAWSEATQAAVQNGRDVAGEVLRDRLKPSDKEPEKGFIRDFLSRGLQKGDSFASRITPFAFSRPDITDYLPLQVLLPDAAAKGKTWESLRQEQAKETQKQGDFKGWLNRGYGRRANVRDVFAEDRIVEAASRMTDRSEFDRLLKVLQREASDRSR